jgi:hypothetical protein
MVAELPGETDSVEMVMPLIGSVSDLPAASGAS